jgi:hypothetical protein
MSFPSVPGMAPSRYSTTISGQQMFWQLFEIYPSLEPLYTAPEKNWKTIEAVEFAQNYWTLPLFIVVGYLLFCYYGQRVMADRKAFDLKPQLRLWNLFLCLFRFVSGLA